MMDWQERVFTAQRTLNDVSAALRNLSGMFLKSLIRVLWHTPV